MLAALDRALVGGALALAAILLAVMAGVAFWQVITRFVFERPSTWSEVTSRSLQIWMVYLGLVAAFRTGALMSVDMALRLAPRRARRALTALIAGLNLGTLAVMLWFGIQMTRRVSTQRLAGVENPFTGGPVSIAVVYAAIPAGAALCIPAVLARLAEEWRALRLGAPPPEAPPEAA